MLKVDATRISSFQILRFQGEWDFVTKNEADSHFKSALEDSSNGVLFDLTEVSLMDSTAIGMLILYSAWLTEKGKPSGLIISGNNYLANKFVKLGMFQGTGLNSYRSVNEALMSLSNI